MKKMDEQFTRFAARYLASLDSPLALSVSILMEYKEWEQIAKKKISPMQYETLLHEGIEKYRRDASAVNFLRKANFLPLEGDIADSAARSRFLEGERQCYKTNRLLDRVEFPLAEDNSPLLNAYRQKLNVAKRWLHKTLGTLPDQLKPAFGPGTIFEFNTGACDVGTSPTAIDKMRFPPFCLKSTPQWMRKHLFYETAYGRAFGFERFSDSQNWVYGSRELPDLCETRGNVFSVIPKTADVGRGICIEPGLNIFGQKGIGNILRQRLKRVGIDLKWSDSGRHFWDSWTAYSEVLGDDRPYYSYHFKEELARQPFQNYRRERREQVGGQPLHRFLAEIGSTLEHVSTIDLSNASETIAHNLVRYLLPTEWFDLLSALRSPFVLFAPAKGVNRKWLKLEKFSSMGNGFTFELETLIFCSLLHACGCKVGTDSWAYGDDIIVPTERTRDVLALLQMSGFTPNLDKTFVTGEFRESCGGDFLQGMDVRPFFLKELPNEPSDWIVIANNLWRRSIDWNMPELIAVRNSALDNVPRIIRTLCRGPKQFGDTVIHSHEREWRTWQRHGQRFFWAWQPIFKRRPVNLSPRARLSAAIMGIPSSGVTPRGNAGIGGYRLGKVVFS